MFPDTTDDERYQEYLKVCELLEEAAIAII
jgi:hypothetical protein